MAKKYRQIITLEVEAVQWKGNNLNEILEFIGNKHISVALSDYIVKDMNGDVYTVEKDVFEHFYKEIK